MKKSHGIFILIIIFLFSCTKEDEMVLEDTNKELVTKSFLGGFCKNCGTQFPTIDVFPAVNGGVQLTWGQSNRNSRFRLNLSIKEYFDPSLPYPVIKTYSRDINTSYSTEYIDSKLTSVSFATYWVKCLECNDGSSFGWKNLFNGPTMEYIMKGEDGDCLNNYSKVALTIQSQRCKIENIGERSLKDWDNLKIDRLNITEHRNGSFYQTYTINVKEGVFFNLPLELRSSYNLKFYSSECSHNDLHYIKSDYGVYAPQGPSSLTNREVNLHKRLFAPH